MKVLLCFLFLSVVSASLLFGEVEIKEQDKSLNDLVRKTLEYFRWLLQRHEPVEFPSLPEFHFTNDDVKITFSSMDVKISKLKDFTVDKVTNTVSKDGVDFSYGITIPKFLIEGTYAITGKAFKKDVSGSGAFSVEMTNIEQSSEVRFAVVESYLQIQDIHLDYQLLGAKFSIDGLKIDGVTRDEIEGFLNKNFVAYLEDNKTKFCQEMAQRLQIVLSQILYQLTLEDVINWLQHTVDSTPDPPRLPWSH